MNWISELYQETNTIWKKSGSDENGYAIFYSPVSLQPEILIIGFNPGGGAKDFTNKEQPTVHDYVGGTYRLATNMKKIFDAAQLPIENTVKFNLIFFRSKSAMEMKNKALIDFSIGKTTEIINRIQPKVIIAEGFKTFETLLKITDGSQPTIIKSNYRERALVQIAKTKEQVKIIGLLHPSGARPSNKELEQMGSIISKEVK